MTQGAQLRTQRMPAFTVDDHVWVQQQIEKRAHALWRAGGCRKGVALGDWLQAEGEISQEFILAYAQRHSPPRAPGPRSRPRTRTPGSDVQTLKRRPAIRRGNPAPASDLP
jgi:hypothetical protein